MTEGVRKVIHVDMDTFYASVEQRDNPALRGKPLAVAWGGKRAVVLTASYQARASGVRSALPLHLARERCPELVTVPPRFEVYREVSAQLRELLGRYTALVEPVALDEAYLDVTSPLRGGPSATRIAQALKAEIRAETGLSATAGVSVNKFLAKLATGIQKPDGLTVLLPAQAEALLLTLPVGRFHGIGPATAARLEQLGIVTGADLRRTPLEQLRQFFGQHGEHYWQIARGQDDRPVDPHRIRSSVGTEETYQDDLQTLSDLVARLDALAAGVARRLERVGMVGRVVMLKLKFADRQVVTRQTTLTAPTANEAQIAAIAGRLLTPELLAGRAVRLAGITVTGLCTVQQAQAQPLLWES